MEILKIVLKNGNSQFFIWKIVKNWEFPFFVLKMIEYFGNSHVFFTLATKKVLIFLFYFIFFGFPNLKCGWNFWDSHVFFRGCASNFWNSPMGPMFRDFYWKSDPLEQHIPVSPWYKSTPPPECLFSDHLWPFSLHLFPTSFLLNSSNPFSCLRWC